MSYLYIYTYSPGLMGLGLTGLESTAQDSIYKKKGVAVKGTTSNKSEERKHKQLSSLSDATGLFADH
jgi:hypothetical protein